MKIRFHKNFDKQCNKLSKKLQAKTEERLALFLEDPFNPILNNHPLKGGHKDYRSINITGNFRAIFKFIDERECIFVAVDTHPHLYS